MCKNCGKPISVRSKFCSVSCSTSFNNKIRKRPHQNLLKVVILCTKCGIKISRNSYKDRRTVCIDCRHPIEAKTLEQLKKGRANHFGFPMIGEHARRIYKKSELPKHCFICGYDKHYDVCHIKAVKDFESNSTIGEINQLSNLVALCKNHHWEFDNGLIALSI